MGHGWLNHIACRRRAPRTVRQNHLSRTVRSARPPRLRVLPSLLYNPLVNAYESSARQAAIAVVRILREAGHQAYFAGGCVRDALLGKAPQDYDIATDARPDRVRELFRHSRYVGEAFGVVLVSKLGDQAEKHHDHPQSRDGRWIHTIEVATFRTEWGYADGRRPTGVDFCDAENDARRRDFTINGLFEDPLAPSHEARIIDHVGGKRDLEAGIIRAIGDPEERFGEDYLRLLRAVRFAARLDFQLDSATARAMRRHAADLVKISRERIGQEVLAMMTGPRPARCIRLMQRLGLDGAVLSEPPQRWPLPTVVAAGRVARKEKVDPTTLLAAWIIDRHLHDLAPDHVTLEVFMTHTLGSLLSRWRAALCLSNELRDQLKHTLQALPEALHWPTLRVARRKRLLARSTWPATWALLRSGRTKEVMAAVVREIEHDAPPLFQEGVAPLPLVMGDDLVAIGISPGPRLGRLLESLYDHQLENITVTREKLLELATSGEFI